MVFCPGDDLVVHAANHAANKPLPLHIYYQELLLKEAGKTIPGTNRQQWRFVTKDHDLPLIAPGTKGRLDVAFEEREPLAVFEFTIRTDCKPSQALPSVELPSSQPGNEPIVRVPSDKLDLKEASVDGDQLTLVFTNWTASCAELLSADGSIVGNRNVFCDSGTGVEISKYEHVIRAQDRVMLCTRTNSGLQCSNPVVVTGSDRRLVLKYARKASEGFDIGYSKNFRTCAHLYREDGTLVLKENLLCEGSTDEQVDTHIPLGRISPAADGVRDLRVGERLRLVHGNNAAVTSGWTVVE